MGAEKKVQQEADRRLSDASRHRCFGQRVAPYARRLKRQSLAGPEMGVMVSMSITTGLELAALIVIEGTISLCAFAAWLAWHKDRRDHGSS